MLVTHPHPKLELLMATASARLGSLITRTALARELGLAPGNLSNWFPRYAEKSEVPPERITQIEDAFAREKILLPPGWRTITPDELEAHLKRQVPSLQDTSLPRYLFAPLITKNTFVDIETDKTATMGFGVPQNARQSFPTGTTGRFHVTMPFSGHLTLLGAEAFGGWWTYWCFNNLAGCEGVQLAAGLQQLPPDGRRLPVGDVPSDSALVAIASRAHLTLPWLGQPIQQGAVEAHPSELRELVHQLLDQPSDERALTLIEYRVVSL